MIQKYGCGVAAGTDLLLYLSLYKESCASSLLGKMTEGSGILETEQYLECAKKMRHSYFPVIPYFGMPGWLLCRHQSLFPVCEDSSEGILRGTGKEYLEQDQRHAGARHSGDPSSGTELPHSLETPQAGAL